MQLGDVANEHAAANGRPLDGVRILALEQMQALPFATQLLARLGADVIKVEHPKGGDSGRGSLPAMADPEGRRVGATFLRNNLNKRSIAIDLKSPEGRQLVLDLAPRFDVVAENSKAGAMGRLGLGWDDIAAVAPRTSYLSVSGFGATGSPYDRWPAYAPIAEAMSGIYEFKRTGESPPMVAPMGGLGDIGSALFATVGVLAALRHRDATGRGQRIDVAMLDAMVAICDLVPNFWSMGLRNGQPLLLMLDQGDRRQATRQAHTQVVAEPVDGVVPSLGHQAERSIGQVGVLLGQEPVDQSLVDVDFGGGLVLRARRRQHRIIDVDRFERAHVLTLSDADDEVVRLPRSGSHRTCPRCGRTTTGSRTRTEQDLNLSAMWSSHDQIADKNRSNRAQAMVPASWRAASRAASRPSSAARTSSVCSPNHGTLVSGPSATSDIFTGLPGTRTGWSTPSVRGMATSMLRAAT